MSGSDSGNTTNQFGCRDSSHSLLVQVRNFYCSKTLCSVDSHGKTRWSSQKTPGHLLVIMLRIATFQA
ncbi:hypothetical protein AVEN_125816-1, partial [Araneus ventricosus]